MIRHFLKLDMDKMKKIKNISTYVIASDMQVLN